MKLLRDPLVHFVVAAALIFGLYQIWQTRSDAARSTIFISAEELERMAALYTSEAGALPTETDMAAMVSDHVRDEALAREARRLGLNEDDTIITRRLAQKMSFVVSDLDDAPEPDEAALRDWMAAHPDRFSVPATVTFSHVYFSPDVHGADTQQNAQVALDQLIADPAIDPARMGDPFMMQRQYGDIPMRELARQFGGMFAEAVFALPVSDTWQGPVESAYGLHLVKVTGATPETQPPFEDIEAQVRKDWIEETRRAANEQAIRDIVSKYRVELEGVE